MNALIELLILIIVAALSGGFAQALFGIRRSNILVSIGIGLIGAYIGTYLAQWLSFPRILVVPIGSSNIEIVWAFFGSLVLVFIINLVEGVHSPPRRR